jgi:prepilin signal peptidase PulO-like enzyme (type II secretory pathway)
MNQYLWVYIAYAFFFGLALGSFLDVVINRTHGEKSWWNGRSRCDNCERNLEWRELIPVLSYILQKGRCKKCKSKLSLEYPLIELFTGFSMAFLVYKFGIGGQVIILGLLALLLIGNFVSDLKYMELPEIFSLSSIVLALIYQYFYGGEGLKSVLIAIAVGGGFFLIQYILTKGEGLGSGDIRLGVLMGALLGWPLVVFSLMLAYVGGSIIALSLIATKRMSRKSAIPLGVFLIPALVIVFIFKEESLSLINSVLWYNTAV